MLFESKSPKVKTYDRLITLCEMHFRAALLFGLFGNRLLRNSILSMASQKETI